MKLEQLQEGVKFGRKEIALVQKEASDILIGLEFEYYYNQDWIRDNEYDGIEDTFIAREELLLNGSDWNINPSLIAKITEDGSVKRHLPTHIQAGVEVVTKPLPLNQAIDFMKKMFRHIDIAGDTDGTTGLHVNVSFKGLSFDDDQFDAFKLVVLLDETFMIKHVRYPVRKFVDKMLFAFDNVETLFTMASAYIVGGPDMLLQKFKEEINLDMKSQGISFTNALGPYNPDDFTEIKEEERRIEFRHIGGPDYETRFDEIAWDIHRYLYLTMVSFVPEFAKKEYQQKIIQILNRKVDKHAKGKTFFDMVTRLKKEEI